MNICAEYLFTSLYTMGYNCFIVGCKVLSLVFRAAIAAYTGIGPVFAAGF